MTEYKKIKTHSHRLGVFRIETPWSIVEGHSTMYKTGTGCFPLCKKCWSELTPDERMPFYNLLIKERMVYDPDNHRDYSLIRKAVKEGK